MVLPVRAVGSAQGVMRVTNTRGNAAVNLLVGGASRSVIENAVGMARDALLRLLAVHMRGLPVRQLLPIQSLSQSLGFLGGLPARRQ